MKFKFEIETETSPGQHRLLAIKIGEGGEKSELLGVYAGSFTYLYSCIAKHVREEIGIPPVKGYETYMLPAYVRSYLGPPVIMYKDKRGGPFLFKGSKITTPIEASARTGAVGARVEIAKTIRGILYPDRT